MALTPKEFYEKAVKELGPGIVAFASVSDAYGGHYFDSSDAQPHQHQTQYWLAGNEIDGNSADTPEGAIANVKKMVARKAELDEFRAWKAAKAAKC